MTRRMNTRREAIGTRAAVAGRDAGPGRWFDALDAQAPGMEGDDGHANREG
jgi:hypothetical protein